MMSSVSFGWISQKRFSRVLAIALGLLLTAAIVWPCFLTLKDAVERTFWFHLTGDESYHSEAIEVLSQIGQYRFWNGQLFFASTGPTVIAPAAMLEKILNIPGAMAGRFVVLLYCLGSLAIVGLSLFRNPLPNLSRANQVLLSLAGVGIYATVCRGLQDTGYYAFGVMGEGAGAFSLLLGFYCLQRRYFFAAGIATALSILAKPFFGLMLIAMVVVILTEGPWRKRFRNIIRFGTGFAVPFALFFTLMLLGSHFMEVITFWKEFPRRLLGFAPADRAAVSLFSSKGLSEALHRHGSGLLRIFKVKSLIIAVVGSVLLYRVRWSLGLRFLATMAFLHFSWWMLASPWAESRYLYPAVVAMALASALGFVIWAAPWFERFCPRTHIGLPILLLIAIIAYHSVSPIRALSVFRHDLVSTGLGRQLLVQKFWKGLKSRNAAWVDSTDSPMGLDYVLTAPYDLKQLDVKNRVLPPAGSWIILGEYPTVALNTWFSQQAHCFPVFQPSLGYRQGIWQCD